ncbi:hypothetical protein [Methylobacillus flagellatus]|uniref:DUF4376 domain-containing protein n=1 Tax=Methylobacillus flagellatus (strain ATCC 51484 / DSM 6875 / VKM B-1610 / KT) TaxID=265072 RepID=Q1GXU1_METFK|nr:hypothetical protein [Methylobacillus flagellatus]ABE50946.1 hypothetical protein Mfla_2683 [Methylobacillus flagellatus KT]
MKNFALIKNGLPIQVVTPALDNTYSDGQYEHGGIWREFSNNISHHEILNDWYYKDGWYQRPASPGPYYHWQNEVESWVFDMDAARSAKSEVIRKACEDAILAGFQSLALGSPHQYPSDLEDQANLSSSVMRSTLPDSDPDQLYPFKCRSIEGVWEFRSHTAAQIQQVGRDSYAVILGHRQRHAQLQTLIQLARSETELEVIAWNQ